MEEILSFDKISKSFPGVRALDDVSFGLMRGEVHAIVGENGAGKSTLMKILSGAYTADTGRMIFEGREIVNNSPKLSRDLGIQMIYQELNLVPELSIASNIFLGQELKQGLFVNKGEQVKRCREALQELGLHISPNTLVKNLSIGAQQLVEIGKALSVNAKILVFDEPTSSLTDSEIQELFRIIRMLKARGVGMFYISHRLDELFEIGDRVTVLRDGKHIMTDRIENVTINGIIEAIAGRKIENLYPRNRGEVGAPMLEINHLSGEAFQDVSLVVREGEIVGMAGLIGAGRSEVAKAAFGIDKYKAGEVKIGGKTVSRHNPQKTKKAGMSLIPENRKLEGLALSLSIRENTVIANLQALNPTSMINRKREEDTVKEYVDKLNIATSSIEKRTMFLSGGTQQKVVLAKWLLGKSQVFIFDEPTRGIDVGAKNSIYELMDELANRGAAILMISSELPEILGMSDRIYVMSGGQVVGEFNASDTTQHQILELAFSNA